MRTTLRSRLSLLFMSFALLLVIPAVAFADIVADSINEVSTSVGSRTIVAGDTTSVGYKILNQNIQQGDTQNSCNPADGSAANLAFNITGVTASPNPLVINQCSNTFSNASFSSEKAGTYTITPAVTDSGGGDYRTAPATWSLTVAKAKTLITEVSGSGTYGGSNGTLTAKLLSYKTDNTTINKPLANKPVTFRIGGNVVPGTATTNNDGVATLHNVDLSNHTFGHPTVEAYFAGDDGYLSTSNSGNSNFTPPPDSTVPAITANVTGTKGLNDWYTSDVGVSWSVSEPESTISSQSGCGSTSVTSDTSGTTFTCTATSAGGTSSKSVTIKRDATAPTVTPGAATANPNGAGWYKDDVTVNFSASDGRSGLADPAKASFTQKTSGEGTDVKANSDNVYDNAGNKASAQSAGFKVDKTAPEVAYKSASPLANAAGWHKDDVTATFEATDSLSGMGATDTEKTATDTAKTSGEGANVTVGSPAFTDRAGNTALAGKATSDPFKIDKTAPAQPGVTFTPAVPIANSGGYFKDTVTVSYGPSSDTGSGVKSVSANQTFDTTGTHTYSGFAEDKAGNKSSAASGSVKVDADAPVVNPNSVVNSVWRNIPLSESFKATDAGSGLNESGLAADGSLTFDLTASEESQDANSPRVAQRTISDKVGHEVTRSVSAFIDLTNPTISASVLNNPDASSGWYNIKTGAPVVRFVCSDALSGIAAGACPADHTVTTEGPNQGYSNSVSDRASNSNSAGVSGLKIDLTAPNAAGAPDLLASSDSGDNSDNLTNVEAPTFDITAEAGSTVKLYAKKVGGVETFIGQAMAANGTATMTSNQNLADGDYQVYARVIDQAGNVSDTNAVNITIVTVDTAAPIFSGVPSDQIVEATSASGARVAYTAPTANDSVDGNVAVDCQPASNVIFPLGTTKVECSATDKAGNSASASFNVTVRDTTGPALSLPSDFSREATGPNGAAVSFTASAKDAVDGARVVNCTPNSGSIFALGTTQVSCSASDSRNNTSTSTFAVTVQDTTAPTLNMPSNINATATSSAGAVVNYTATATDLVDSNPLVNCTPPSGSTFAVGTTQVSCTAKDVKGNTSAASTFNVNVAYSWSNFLQPINTTINMPTNYQQSIFKMGSTVPVKFQLTGASSGITDGNFYLKYVRTGSGDGLGEAEVVATSTGSTGTQFRYDSTSGQYIFNWSTKGFTQAGNYELRVYTDSAGTNLLGKVSIELKK